MTNVRPQYLVALSGGADSVCLLLTLLEKGEVGAAAHCNFHCAATRATAMKNLCANCACNVV